MSPQGAGDLDFFYEESPAVDVRIGGCSDGFSPK